MRVRCPNARALVVAIAVTTAWPWTLALSLVEAAQKAPAQNAPVVGAAASAMPVRVPTVTRNDRHGPSALATSSLVFDEANDEDSDSGPEALSLLHLDLVDGSRNTSVVRFLESRTQFCPTSLASQHFPLRC